MRYVCRAKDDDAVGNIEKGEGRYVESALGYGVGKSVRRVFGCGLFDDWAFTVAHSARAIQFIRSGTKSFD